MNSGINLEESACCLFLILKGMVYRVMSFGEQFHIIQAFFNQSRLC